MNRRNVGTLDAYLRIALGFGALAWGLSGRAGRLHQVLSLWGAMCVAAGVTRFSPLLALFGTTTLESVAEYPGRGGVDEYKRRHPLPSPVGPLA